MKVSKNTKSKFEPITIVLETKEEADIMFDRLNVNSKEIEDGYAAKYLGVGKIHGIGMSMWHEFDRIYHPEERRG